MVMKLRGKVAAGLVIGLVIAAVLLLSQQNPARRELARTRRALQRQGFKVELSQFDLKTSAEMSSRAALLGTTTFAALTNRAGPQLWVREFPELLQPTEGSSALVVWRLQKLKYYRNPDLWPDLHEFVRTNRARLDAALRAALGGPIRFEPIGTPNPLLPYLGDIRNMENAFAVQTLVALHDGRTLQAWTNLLAATCLVTEYAPEPIEISHLVRFACATIAYNLTWNSLQAGAWTDAQLAELQGRWESANFCSGLPETAAFSRAETAALIQRDRRDSLNLLEALKAVIHVPRDALPVLQSVWHRIQYVREGSYGDEKAVLLYFRDREIELRRAFAAQSWAEMRTLPGVTNHIPLALGRGSRTQALVNSQQLRLAMQGRGRGLLANAAEAETRRRLLVTALAIERYHIQYGTYPARLEDLLPSLLKALPTDFMDGQPLRYRLTGDGHFVLYSVGLDGVDNGGRIQPPALHGRPYDPFGGEFGFRQGADLVWPRPAAAEEAQKLFEEQGKAEADRNERMEANWASQHWRRADERQARAGAILESWRPPRAAEPVYQGRPLSQVLRNPATSGTNNRTLTDLLSLNHVMADGEPEIVTFELPISYDTLTNLGALCLYIDPWRSDDSDEDCTVGQFECKGATNGDCLLVWNAIYDAPGEHALQVGLLLGPQANTEQICGPPRPFVVSNLCQFSLSSASFTPERGPTFRARFPEPNASYSIEIRSPGGERLKTLTGSTSAGMLTAHWNLKDERGVSCTNSSYDSVIHVTLLDSGRSQTLKGP